MGGIIIVYIWMGHTEYYCIAVCFRHRFLGVSRERGSPPPCGKGPTRFGPHPPSGFFRRRDTPHCLLPPVLRPRSALPRPSCRGGPSVVVRPRLAISAAPGPRRNERGGPRGRGGAIEDGRQGPRIAGGRARGLLFAGRLAFGHEGNPRLGGGGRSSALFESRQRTGARDTPPRYHREHPVVKMLSRPVLAASAAFLTPPAVFCRRLFWPGPSRLRLRSQRTAPERAPHARAPRTQNRAPPHRHTHPYGRASSGVFFCSASVPGVPVCSTRPRTPSAPLRTPPAPAPTASIARGTSPQARLVPDPPRDPRAAG
jgi:hypothetical protein